MPWALPDVAGLPSHGYRVELAELRVCPGWLVAQPAVDEAAQAAAALDAGAIETYYPRAKNALLESALLVRGAFKEYESACIKRDAPK